MCDPVTGFLSAVGSGISAGAVTGGAALATGAVVVGGTVGSLGMQYKGYQAGKDAARTQQAMEALRAQRSQIQALREAQIQRAMLTQRSIASGTADSSGFAGGMGSIGSQLAGNQMFANQMTAFGQQLAGQQQSANRYTAVGSLFGQAAQSAASIASLYGKANQQVPQNQYSSAAINRASMNDLYAGPFETYT